jgi:hypothetical protein
MDTMLRFESHAAWTADTLTGVSLRRIGTFTVCASTRRRYSEVLREVWYLSCTTTFTNCT